MAAFTEDHQNAAKIAGGIGDNAADIMVGKVTKATSSTTATVTFTGTSVPDFVLYGLVGANASVTLSHAVNATTQVITFTRGTATESWSVSYILGYTA